MRLLGVPFGAAGNRGPLARELPGEVEPRRLASGSAREVHALGRDRDLPLVAGEDLGGAVHLTVVHAGVERDALAADEERQEAQRTR